MKNSRRSFLQTLGLGSLAAGLVPNSSGAYPLISDLKPVAANDKIRLGLIGAGIIGHFDLDCALRVPGTEVAAVCDLYEGRRTRAKEKWGKDIFITKDYRELLAKKDIDAVLICTSDHWHDRISIDALNAGKHVYCEKPMVHHIEEGIGVIAAQKKSGKVFQVGSQRASASAILKAREYFQQGLIGELTFVEAFCDRSDSRGAWQYSIPSDASEKTIDWDTYLGDAPKTKFDVNRFFRWRNYKDYGTGVAGDLFVHLLTGIHTVTGAIGPSSIYSLGDVTYWKDGRDAYDLVNAIMQYQKTDKHPAFQFVTRVNLADGRGGGLQTRWIGTEGVIEVGWNDLTVKHFKRPLAPGYGGYDSYESFSAAEQKKFADDYKAKYTEKMEEWTNFPEIKFVAPDDYDDRYDHMLTFFNAVRGQGKVLEDATFGLRAAAPSLACNLSAELHKPIKWDPVNLKIVG